MGIGGKRYLKYSGMKRSILLIIFLGFFQNIQAQNDISLTDFYLSVGYRNQPYSSLNQRLEQNNYESFNRHVGTLGGGFSYLPKSGLGVFAETELNMNKKGFNNNQVNYRYLPIHFTAGVQYHFLNSRTANWRFYPKLGVFFGTTSLDLIIHNPNRDFNENLMGAMNTSFLYQENYGLNLSVNADKLIGSFIKPTTQVGIYSRIGIQAGYILNLFSSRTKLRRNFNQTLKDDFAMVNSPTFDPSAFYVKLNFAIGKFTSTEAD